MEIDAIFEVLKRECRPFIDKLKCCKKGHFLIRGYFYDIPNIQEFNHNLEYRKPKSMDPDVHDKINNYFLPKFHWKIRNGIFSYGFDLLTNKPVDLGYGTFYIFFPVGNFEYIYSLEHFDLWVYFRLTKGDVDQMIKNLKFENSSFCNVMKLRDEFDQFGNEVSVKATQYFLINTKYAKELSEKIWS